MAAAPSRTSRYNTSSRLPGVEAVFNFRDRHPPGPDGATTLTAATAVAVAKAGAGGKKSAAAGQSPLREGWREEEGECNGSSLTPPPPPPPRPTLE